MEAAGVAPVPTIETEEMHEAGLDYFEIMDPDTAAEPLSDMYRAMTTAGPYRRKE